MGDQPNLEDEMSRFEQEILGSAPSQPSQSPASQSVVIGASTFTSVQEQLSALRAQVYGAGANVNQSRPPNHHANQQGSSPNLQPFPPGIQQRQVMSAPPRPPGFRPSMNGNLDAPNGFKPLSGPPPPPSLAGAPRPASFVPSQLRARAPAPPHSQMSRPHMPGPPTQRPPANFHGPPMQRPPMQGPPMMPPMRPPPGMMPGMSQSMRPIGPGGPQHSSLSGTPVRYTQPAVVEAPKVVYSSKPVINKPGKKDTASSESDKQEKTNDRKRGAPDQATFNMPVGETLTAVDAQSSGASAIDTSQSAPKKDKKNKVKEKRCIRTAANEVWEDHSLAEWDPNDFRVFCGDLGNEVTDEKLAEAFKKYPSLQKAKVIRDRRTHKTKGYGFISFKDPTDYTRAMREMNGKYVGNRPIKLRKSNWRDRNVEVVKKKDREKKRLGFR